MPTGPWWIFRDLMHTSDDGSTTLASPVRLFSAAAAFVGKKKELGVWEQVLAMLLEWRNGSFPTPTHAHTHVYVSSDSVK